ncbi:hypothetical protein Tco_1492402 [Tanacetum coccineum]
MTDKDSSAAGSKPMTPFVHTRPANNEVHKKVWKIKEYLTAFEPIIQNGRAQPCWSEYRRSFVNEIIPFYENIKNLSQNLDTDIYTEVKEFERSLDKMESDYDKCLADNKRLGDKNKHLLAKTRRLQRVMTNLSNDNERFIADNIAKDICSFVLSSEKQVSPRSNCSCKELQSNYDKGHSRVPNTKAATTDLHKELLGTRNQGLGYIAKRAQLYCTMLVPYLHPDSPSVSHMVSEDVLAYWLPANEIASQASNPDRPVTPFIHTRPPPSQVLANLQKVNAVFHQFEGNTLKFLKLMHESFKTTKDGHDLRNGSTEGSCDQQALDTDRIQLQDTITSLRIQLDGLKVENVSLKKRYDELSKANTHSRTAYINKLSALTAEHKKLQAQVTGKTSSGSTASEKPKVLASGMYTNSSKYVPPPKRANWVKPTPLPKNKQVTFQEPPRTSNRPTQKPQVQQNMKPKVPVNLSTRTKPATESRKPMPKSHTRNHRILPSTSVNARRAADHNRKLNVVDHNQFVVRSLKSVNTKTPHAKHSVNHTKKVWKATRNHNVKPQWKPTGRHFALYDNCPLTRIMEPIVEPLELTPSVSSSSKVTMISRSKGRTVADSIAERLTRPTAYKFKTDCSIIPVWIKQAYGNLDTSNRRNLRGFELDKTVKEGSLLNLSDTSAYCMYWSSSSTLLSNQESTTQSKRVTG